jgi:hypothetical protein
MSSSILWVPTPTPTTSGVDKPAGPGPRGRGGVRKPQERSSERTRRSVATPGSARPRELDACIQCARSLPLRSRRGVFRHLGRRIPHRIKNLASWASTRDPCRHSTPVDLEPGKWVARTPDPSGTGADPPGGLPPPPAGRRSRNIVISRDWQGRQNVNSHTRLRYRPACACVSHQARRPSYSYESLTTCNPLISLKSSEAILIHLG